MRLIDYTEKVDSKTDSYHRRIKELMPSLKQVALRLNYVSASALLNFSDQNWILQIQLLADLILHLFLYWKST